MKIVISFSFLLWMLYQLKVYIDANYIPGIFVMGLFSLIPLILFLDALPGTFKKSKTPINQKTHEYEFDPGGMTWSDLKKSVETYYRPFGFTNVVIDKADAWMIKNPENEEAYVLVSFKANRFKLEAYNTHAFDLHDQKMNDSKVDGNA
ncbi:hypothetical protein WCX72_01365 [Sulfurimonas sp. HSL1-6]|uniref:hypothetical protein n=1 Tax=Thiomicrolovo immobilis TaxID=3131935 RepID=UPI0031F8B545